MQESARCRRCNHDGISHQHYRPGTECGLCLCPAFLPTRWWHRLHSERK